MKPEIKFEQTAANLLRDMVSMFITYPDDFKVTAGRYSNIIRLGWVGNRADVSRMIGTGGKTYNALRDLMKLIGEQHGCEIELTRVCDPIKGKPERYHPFKDNTNWPRERILQLLERAAVLGSRTGRSETGSGDLDKDSTGLHVALCRTETLNTEAVLSRTLKHIFNVIGNANGRILIVSVTRELEPEIMQPATADGRFTKMET